MPIKKRILLIYKLVKGLPWISMFLAIILLSGMLIRLINYLHNRNLWLDEAMLARNILDRGPMELLTPLDYNQVAPVLFLLLVDVAVTLFGASEFALRLVPLLASFISILLFVFTAKLFLEKRYVLIAAVMFAYSFNLVYYSQELKQYSTDVAVAIALTYLSLRLINGIEFHKRDLFLLGLTGGMSIFLSYPAIFILAGIGTILVILAVCNRLPFSLNTISIMILGWGVCFGVNYLLFLRPLSSNQFLVNYWKEGFLPIPICTAALKSWYNAGIDFLAYCDYGYGWFVLALSLISVAVGVALVSRSFPTLMIALYFVFALCVSVMGKYPFSSRLSLYLIPFVILLSVKGLQILSSNKTVIISAILSLFLLAPAFLSLQRIASKPFFVLEEVKPLLAYIHAYRQSDDHVYIYYAGQYAVKYYLRDNNSMDKFIHYGVESRDDRSKYIADINKMKQYPRVWFLFSHNVQDEESFFLSGLSNAGGELLVKHQNPGVNLYLYRFPHTNISRTHRNASQ